MNVEISNQIRIKNPTPEILDYCKKNLRLSNPEYTKKLRMGFWIGNTPEYLYLYEIHGNELVLPYGTLSEITRFVSDADIRFERIKKEQLVLELFSVDFGLYDYQQEAVDEVILWNLCGIIQSKPGTGKTQVGLALACKLGLKTLWLTHTRDLLNQSKERAEKYMDKSLIGTITEGKVNIGKGITFATVQTMSHLDLSLLKHEWGTIIVDECHRVCTSATSVTMFAHVLNNLAARHKYGLSATVHRADGLIEATYSLLGKVIYSVPDEAISDITMNASIYPVCTGTQMTLDCLNSDGTICYTKLINYLAESKSRSALISSCIADNVGHSCLILSDRLEHLKLMMNYLPDHMRMDAVMISGKMASKKAKAEREQALEDMRTGKKKYLFATYQLAKEGLDVPRLDRLFLTTPQKDYAVVTQSVGRVQRTFEGKEIPVVYDFVDDMAYTVKAYKERKRHYNKMGCTYLSEV